MVTFDGNGDGSPLMMMMINFCISNIIFMKLIKELIKFCCFPYKKISVPET